VTIAIRSRMKVGGDEEESPPQRRARILRCCVFDRENSERILRKDGRDYALEWTCSKRFMLEHSIFT